MKKKNCFSLHTSLSIDVTITTMAPFSERDALLHVIEWQIPTAFMFAVPLVCWCVWTIPFRGIQVQDVILVIGAGFENTTQKDHVISRRVAFSTFYLMHRYPVTPSQCIPIAMPYAARKLLRAPAS